MIDNLKKQTVKIVTDNGKCTGCGLCFNICPTDAIEMKTDSQGFYSPVIDFDKCTYCELCYKNCPIISSKNQNKTNPEVYSGWTKNEYYLKNSSSGGIFPELANYFITNYNGIVYGAIWNKFPKVAHIGIDNIDDIPKLMSSKYVQSDIGKTISEIKKYVKNKRNVLFSGLPCQVAGLKNWIKFDNLFTIDVVCHGVPSKKLFRKYVEENKITSMNFRFKKKGWKNFHIKTEKSIKIDTKHHRLDPFFYGYLNNLYLQEICYSCPFSDIPRAGDITLGDYWGIEKRFENPNGTSLIVSNSNKGGKILYEMAERGLITLQTSTISDAFKMNPRLGRGHYNIPKERKRILNMINSYTFKKISEKFFFTNKTKIFEIMRIIYKKFREIL